MFGGGMPGGPPQGAGKKKKEQPKLIDDNNGQFKFYWMINRFYGIWFKAKSYCLSSMWYISCLGLMWAFPVAIENMMEQRRVLEKLQ